MKMRFLVEYSDGTRAFLHVGLNYEGKLVHIKKGKAYPLVDSGETVEIPLYKTVEGQEPPKPRGFGSP